MIPVNENVGLYSHNRKRNLKINSVITKKFSILTSGFLLFMSSPFIVGLLVLFFQSPPPMTESKHFLLTFIQKCVFE